MRASVPALALACLLVVPPAGAFALADVGTYLSEHPDVRDWLFWQLQQRGLAERLSPELETPPPPEAAWYPLWDGGWARWDTPAGGPRLVVVADAAERALPGWQDALRDAVLPALDLLAREGGVRVAAWSLGTTSIADVATVCELQQAAAEQAADLVLVVSPGDIDGRWGMALDGSAPCFGPAVRAAYVRHDPFPWAPRLAMQHLAAHELGHLFGMDHDMAACWADGAVTHKTLEAFTSAPDAPWNCGTQLDPYASYHYTFSWLARWQMASR